MSFLQSVSLIAIEEYGAPDGASVFLVAWRGGAANFLFIARMELGRRFQGLGDLGMGGLVGLAVAQAGMGRAFGPQQNGGFLPKAATGGRTWSRWFRRILP